MKNKFESNFKFGEANTLDKAMNLEFYELIGKAEDINQEVEKYRDVTADRVREVASTIFSENNCSTLYYKAKTNGEAK